MDVFLCHMKTLGKYRIPGCRVNGEGPSFLVLCESCPESLTNWASRSCSLKCVDHDLFQGLLHHLSSTITYNTTNYLFTTASLFEEINVLICLVHAYNTVHICGPPGFLTSIKIVRHN